MNECLRLEFDKVQSSVPLPGLMNKVPANFQHEQEFKYLFKRLFKVVLSIQK